jgi:hypothetical protein
MGFRGGPPRRSPYPADMRFAGVRMMLGYASADGATKGSQLVAVKPQTQDRAAPTAFGYDAQNPIIDRVQPWDDLTLGFGLKMQDQFRDKRYRYATNVDVATGTWTKGPAITTITPGTVDATNGISSFQEIGGAIYAVNGRYVTKRVNDSTFSTSRDLGAGKVATDAVVFYSNGAAAQLMFVALGDADNFHYYDGATWTQHATLKARAFVALSREFYRATGNSLAKVDPDADPTVAANWSSDNAFTVGSKDYSINRLIRTPAGAMLVIKPDGVYTLDEAGLDLNLYPHLATNPDTNAGKAYATFLSDLYLNFQNNTYRLKTDFTVSGSRLVLDDGGTERLLANDSPVHGPLTAMAAHGGWFMYAALYNPDTGNAYVCKLGSYVGAEAGDQPDVKRIDAWHGSITPAFTGRKITAMKVSGVGAPANHERMYIGFDNGQWGWFTLPCSPSPLACSSYAFSTTDGHLYAPIWHGLFGNDPKMLRAVTVGNMNASSTNYAQFSYREANGTWNTLGTDFTVGPRQIVEFTSSTQGTMMEFDIVLKSTSTASTPQINGVGLHHTVRPPLYLVYEFDVLAENGQVMRDGRPMHVGASYIRDVVASAANAASMTTIVLPDETTKIVSVVDYAESQAWNERLRKWQASIHVKAAQQLNASVLGTVGRLQPYTVGDLAAYTIAQLGGL